MNNLKGKREKSSIFRLHCKMSKTLKEIKKTVTKGFNCENSLITSKKSRITKKFCIIFK